MAMMTPDLTNLHFHGLSIPPSCHADESIRTTVPPGTAFVYRFRIPKDQPPGLYWYHPHIHGNSEEQVLGGASGALIVEGISHANPLVAGLPERVLVVRDQKLDRAASMASAHDPTRPAKDLSINFIAVPYPKYPVATIQTKPLQREFWRVLNASADTYINLGVLFNGQWTDSGLAAVNASWQSLGLVAVDGVPIADANSGTQNILWEKEILIPPGGRAEFIFETPPVGTTAELLTSGTQTSPSDDDDSNPLAVAVARSSMLDQDDYTPPRPLARIVSSATAKDPRVPEGDGLATSLPEATSLATVSPVRERKLYFSEKVMDPRHPETSTIFYITEEGHQPKAFDPSVLTPDIVVHQGDVEDWTIENRSLESHVFHIHQIHFLLLERDGIPPAESYLLDTIDVPFWDGVSADFPRVKLRMDFRDPNIVGTFPYHCHILQHADGGMMGLIEVRRKKQN
jgi:FtsP/CotA-like multicopper oxidase with cupredoxin domain